MKIIDRFKSLPVNTRRLLGLGGILAITVALPLFIWAVITQKFLIPQKAQEVPRVTVSTEGAPYLGPLTAPVTIVEFGDFQCPACKTFHDVLLQPLLAAYPNEVRFVFRNFPLTEIHPNAEIAAEAALCANEQGKFWQMSDLLFANQDNLEVNNLKSLAASLNLDTTQFNSCLDTSQFSSVIQQDIADGTSYGVPGTPTFFINGIILTSASSLSDFQTIINQEINPTPSPTATPTEAPSASPSASPEPTLSIITDSFIDGRVGVGYRNFFYGEETNFTSIPTLSLSTTNRPPGISMPAALCGSSHPTDRLTDTLRFECALDGQPTTAGDYGVIVTLSDNFGRSISKNVPITILPEATPNSCNGTCGSNYNCNGGLYCYQGFCRSSDCPADATCGCVATPTPTPTSKAKSTVKPSPTSEIVYLTPRPTKTPAVFTYISTTPSPTTAPAGETGQSLSPFLWISGGSFAVAIILILFAL